MSDTAFQTVYRNETILGFEQRQSLLRETTTTEAMITGNQAVFLVADSGAATAVTRNPATGLIPGRPDNLAQLTAILTEYQDKAIKTGFNIFASQGNQTSIMQQTSMAVINRTIDINVFTALANATITTGAAVPMGIDSFDKAQATLGAAKVPWDSNIALVISPGAFTQMRRATEFSNSLYTVNKPNDNDPSWTDKPQSYRWSNVHIIVHPYLANTTTPSAEFGYMYHKSSIGHAANIGGMEAVADYDKEDDYSYARTKIYMGSKVLQNSGIVKINIDATGRYGS